MSLCGLSLCLQRQRISSLYRISSCFKSELTSYRRGKGGRQSFSGNVVTVFGCTGYIGQYVVQSLARVGCQVILPYRGEAYDVESMKVFGDLGQIIFVPFHIRDENSLTKSMKYSNTVINLIAREWPTKNFTVEEANVDGPRRIAGIARECGVENFLHFSILNAMYDPPKFYQKGGSAFLRAKAFGEDAVREEFPDAVVFRPADVYGLDDRFVHYYAAQWRRANNIRPWEERKIVPMWKHGVQTTKCPVYLTDVIKAVTYAVNNPKECRGKRYELVGPYRYRLDDLVDYIYGLCRYPPIRTREIWPLFRARCWLIYLIPGYTRLNLERFEREFISDIVVGKPDLTDLGVPNPTCIEDIWQFQTKRHWAKRYYNETVGEFPLPDDPTRLDVISRKEKTIQDTLFGKGVEEEFAMPS